MAISLFVCQVFWSCCWFLFVVCYKWLADSLHPLREIIKRTNMFYRVRLKKYLKKLNRYLWWGLFCEVAWLYTTDYLKWIKHFVRNLERVLTEVWKNKKTKENMKEIKEHEISDTLHWGLGVVSKTDDEIYVSISVGKYTITFYLFSVLFQRRSCCWKYRKWGSHFKNRYLCKGGRKCKDKFFSQSLLHYVIF